MNWMNRTMTLMITMMISSSFGTQNWLEKQEGMESLWKKVFVIVLSEDELNYWKSINIIQILF